MKSTLWCVLACFGLLVMCGPATAADPVAGKARAAGCGGCHGQAGISPNPAWPNLAGQHAAYLKKSLADYKNGLRQEPMMQGQAKGLSQVDMENLAAYYESLPCK